MGLMPPPFMCKAIREAPKRIGHTDGGVVLSSVRLTKEASERRSSSQSFQTDALTVSFRYC